jgi:hypothetical protein
VHVAAVEHLADFDAATQQIVPGRVASIIFSKKVERAAGLSDRFGQLRQMPASGK